MAKYCTHPGCQMPATYCGGTKCIIHAGESQQKAKKKIPMKAISDKRKEENKEYEKLKRQFLKAKPKCEMCSENENTKGIRKATEVHHKYRRKGKAFLDTNTWIASCRNCNSRVESEPEWAKKHKFIATQEELTIYYKQNGKTL